LRANQCIKEIFFYKSQLRNTRRIPRKVSARHIEIIKAWSLW